MTRNPERSGPRALLLNGTVGVGKSSVMGAVSALLRARASPNAYVDIDEVRRMWPAPADDPFNFALAMRNVSSLSTNFVAAGVERLVLAGVAETPAEFEGFKAAVGMPLVTCRLEAEAEVLRERLTARHSDADELCWHLARAPELAEILGAASLDDYSLDVSELSVSVAAIEVVELVGWMA